MGQRNGLRDRRKKKWGRWNGLGEAEEEMRKAERFGGEAKAEKGGHGDAEKVKAK